MSLLEGLLFKKNLAWFNDEKILQVLLWNKKIPEVLSMFRIMNYYDAKV